VLKVAAIFDCSRAAFSNATFMPALFIQKALKLQEFKLGKSGAVQHVSNTCPTSLSLVKKKHEAPLQKKTFASRMEG